MPGKRVLTLKSRKCRFTIRDPCSYPAAIRGMTWNEHLVENLDRAIRQENRDLHIPKDKEGVQRL